MTDSYIVKFLENEEKWNVKCENAKLSTHDGYFTITNDDNDVPLGTFYVKDIPSYRYTTSTKTGGFNFIFENNAVQFDKNSQAAADKFYRYIILENEKNVGFTSHYESGKPKFSGTLVEDKLDGMGTERYDNPSNTYKYIGEFDDGLYDGAGTIFSEDDTIMLKCNNFSKGELMNFVELSIKKKDNTTVKKTLKAHELGQTLVPPDTNQYLLDIARKFYPGFDDEFSTVDDKLESLIKEVREVKDNQKKMMKATRSNSDTLLRVYAAGVTALYIASVFL